MIKSIFDIENRLDIQKEFNKIVMNLHNQKDTCLSFDGYYDSFIGMINEDLFLTWKYRDTFLSVEEYLEHIGVSSDVLSGIFKISAEKFLYYIEFILNMALLSQKKSESTIDQKVYAVLQNINIILEKMNYQSEIVNDDKVIIIKRNEDVDSIIRTIPESKKNVLLEYNDFRNEDDIETKKSLLKILDLYIEENKGKIKSLDSKLYDTIGTIVNKMGINHPIKDFPFNTLKESDLLIWYDNCFLLMIHAIRSIDISKIKNDRDNLINSN